jgi:hypothetical protein
LLDVFIGRRINEGVTIAIEEPPSVNILASSSIDTSSSSAHGRLATVPLRSAARFAMCAARHSREDSKPEIGQLPRLSDHGLLEFDLLTSGMVEEADSVTQQDGGDLDENFVEESLVQALTSDAGAKEADVPVACSRLGSCNGVFDSVVNERSRHPGGKRRWNLVGEDEEGSVPRSSVDPRAISIFHFICATAHDDRARRGDGIVDRVTRRRELEDPLHVVTRRCNEAVQ